MFPTEYMCRIALVCNAFKKIASDIPFAAVCLMGITLVLTQSLNAQSFYDLWKIQEIRIYFGMPDWDYRLDTAKAGSGTYLMADSVVINGKKFLSCGVKYKGYSSYDPARKKNPIHIKLDKWIDQEYEGYDDIKLGNGFSDNSMIRDALGYYILRQYMDAPRSNFARVYINDIYYGLMSNTESIDKRYLLDRYYTSKHTFFKCNPPEEGPGAGNGANLAYLGVNPANYYSKYELKSDTGWHELIQFCDTLNNHFSSFHTIADVDRFLWMLAFNNATINLDSYSGAYRQNYYLYRNHAGQWIPAVWDLNLCFGGFAIAGGNTSNLTPATMPTMSYTLHKNEPAWPLLYKLLNDTTYSKMYDAHLRTINQQNFANGFYKIIADSLHALIESFVYTDTNFLGNYTDFQQSLLANTQVSYTGGTCPGLYPLMDARANYLANVLSAAPPVIGNVTHAGSTGYGDTVFITAHVQNGARVYVGYRYGKQDRFVREMMYDDGSHGDGAAGDGVYGVRVPLRTLTLHYYIYAENAFTGAFSPERAEHEYYSLTATLPTATQGELVINEITANNQTGIQNEAGKYKDWIEIYNTTPKTLALSGLYLSDDAAQLMKWNFPSKAFIKPYERLLVWADDLDKTHLDLHTNFNLSGTGDAIILSDGITIFDSHVFGTSNTDEAMARCPDGSGIFIKTYQRTPRQENDCTAGYKPLAEQRVTIFPNPAWRDIHVVCDEQLLKWQLIDGNGEAIYEGAESTISLPLLPTGLYYLKIFIEEGVVVKKLLLMSHK
ncbi:MAG: CotH kinase family protein [Chitinophagales bacterium]|nr:CotH kinase family protein [Chitinophagales bacterium]